MQGREHTSFNNLLGVTRDAMASGEVVKATVAIIELAPHRDEVSPIELVDLLERSCVYGPCGLVDFVWDELGPFVYTGWALALALRCAREDVARDLLEKGVSLLADVPQGQKFRSIATHEVSLSRFDLTQGSPDLFLHTRKRTVCSEVFEAFTGKEQLVGGSFATATNLAATCDAVGRLAGEGAFDDIVFADLLRAVLVRAEALASQPEASQPEAMQACVKLAGLLLDLHRSQGRGGDYVELVVANMLREGIDLAVTRFLCERDSSLFYEALDSFPWLKKDGTLLRSLVRCLRPGTHEQNARLACVLAKAGYLDELKLVVSWPDSLTSADYDAAIQAASSAGRAEVSAWLLSERTRAFGGNNAALENAQSESNDDLSALFL